MAFNQANQFRVMHPGKPPVRKPQTQSGSTGGKLMRLKCRFRPLQDAYLEDGEITEKETDVVFICSDGRVRAHKIILASASLFFIKIFEDQRSGVMTTVVVPDITSDIMRLILSLTYKDNMTMTPKQVKEVGCFLSLFGMNWKQFHCNDSQNPELSGNALAQSEPQANLPQRRQQQPQQLKQMQQHQRAQQYQQQMNSRMQHHQGPGQMPIKVESALAFGTNGNQPSAKLHTAESLKRKPTHKNQEGLISDGSDNGSEYKFQVQGYTQNQGQHAQSQQGSSAQQVQVRPLKQLLSGGQVQMQVNKMLYGHQNPGENPRGYRRIAPKPMSHGDGEMDLYGGVADQMEIQMETEDGTSDDNIVVDPESGRIMIQEWVQNLGRDNTSLNTKKVVPRMKHGTQNDPRPNKPAPYTSANQCLICNNIFDDDDKWHWHETHHVGLGIFKCAFCDELFSTSRKVYQHEMMEHGVTTTDGPSETPTIPEDFQIVNGRKRKLESTNPSNVRRLQTDRMTLVQTLHGSHYRKLPGGPGPSMKRKIALSKLSRMHLANNFRARNPLIGIAHMEDDDVEETKKIRQLHWIYVCSKCEHGVDSLQKAQIHYKKCFPEGEMKFESTVVKYRQGFFGKIKCPICPRRYTSAAGFKIHCGHMHGDYRRKFSHSNADDTIVCRHCRKRFKDPVDFHYHLSDGECYDAPEFNKDEAAGGRWVGNGNPGDSEENNGPPKLKKEKNSLTSAAGAASSATLNTATLPSHSSSSLSRSTRLTNRILMNSEEGGEHKFPAVTCPVCGTPSVEKIVEHLQIEHTDLDVLVSRVGNGLLRCQKCRITFALCDLLAHIDNCEGMKQFQYVSERRAAQAGSKSRVSGPTCKGTSITIPPGIGCSPVDTIECQDLSSIETLKAAMTCGVCGLSAKKLGVIADCLRSHGINRCALCFNTYTDKITYSTHLKQAHGGGLGRLSCPLCPKTFINAGQVAGHMYSSHWLILLRDKEISDKTIQPKLEPVEVKNEDSNGDHAILTALGLTAAPPKDDYSSITLGSILSSSENSYKNEKRGELELDKSSMDELISTKDDEGQVGDNLQITDEVN